MEYRLSRLTRGLLAVTRLRYEHCLSQKIAFAALAALPDPDADGWCRTILTHADVFALGAAAPDNDFRDFKSHVLYPRDGYWGGAPEKAQIWYRNLVAALKRGELETASYCAGVLSHYTSDICDPLNTQWSDAGGTLHAAIRRSLRVGFERAASETRRASGDRPALALSSEATFLATAIGAAADRANATYEKTIAHYDFGRGVSDARSGFDPIGARMAADIIGSAIDLTAAVFARAIAEASVAVPPPSHLGRRLAAALATAPIGMLRRQSFARAERREIQAIHDELVSSGQVNLSLPDHDRAVRDAYRAEVEAKRPVVPIAQVFPFEPSAASIERVDRLRQSQKQTTATEGEVVAFNRARVAIEPPRPAPPRTVTPALRQRADVVRSIVEEVAAEKAAEAAASEAVASSNVLTLPVRAPEIDPPVVITVTETATPIAVPEPGARPSETPAIAHSITSTVVAEAASRASLRATLTAEQDVAEAPSVGPETAVFLRGVGIDTVEDFLRAHPLALSARLERPEFNAETLEVWQDQARLVMAVPGLRGADAQLFAGAGYRTLDAIAAADAEKLCADMLAFALTRAGQDILQNAAAPPIDRIRAWAEAARAVKAA